MRMTTTPVRSISAAVVAIAVLAACYSSKNAGPSPMPDASGPSDGTGPTPDAAGSITYWMEERTSEIDLQLGTIQPTQGF